MRPRRRLASVGCRWRGFAVRAVHANIWLCHTWTLPSAVGRVDALRVIQNEKNKTKKTAGWTDLQQGYWRKQAIRRTEALVQKKKKEK